VCRAPLDDALEKPQFTRENGSRKIELHDGSFTIQILALERLRTEVVVVLLWRRGKSP